jgi:small GTP-binding protein
MAHVVLRSKLLVVGPATVGKTSLVKAFASDGGAFNASYTMTLAAEISVKGVYNEEHNAQVEFYMYDISGSSIYEYEYPDVFRDANQIMIVFDVTRSSTLAQCGEWLDKVAKYATKSLPGVLVGNKCDLAEFADVSPDDCKNFAVEHGMSYYEVSAKTNAGITEPFNELGEKFIALYESEVDQFINAE